MRPERCLTMGRMTPWMKLKAPFRFVSRTRSQSSSLIRMASPSRVSPALLTRISTRPKSHDPLAESTDGRAVGDIHGVGACGVRRGGMMAPAVFAAFASVRLTQATRAPSRARRRAMASPMPQSGAGDDCDGRGGCRVCHESWKIQVTFTHWRFFALWSMAARTFSFCRPSSKVG